MESSESKLRSSVICAATLATVPLLSLPHKQPLLHPVMIARRTLARYILDSVDVGQILARIQVRAGSFQIVLFCLLLVGADNSDTIKTLKNHTMCHINDFLLEDNDLNLMEDVCIRFPSLRSVLYAVARQGNA